MNFDNIKNKMNQYGKRKNDTKEKVYEFEFYNLMYHLLDCIDSFDKGVRKIDLELDIEELIYRLKHTHQTLKGNLKFLKRDE
jgi:molecular chaperone GrpE (heat shock protein)